ncbi:MAG: UvrB/UvrC motif-containing protein [Eubacteriales bacterium]|nr:UvrB/UvrC motif-containing protein [Eubacteriales bacterium]
MLCENCNINEATIHFTEIRNGVQTEHHLCSECAAALDVPGYLEGMNAEFPFVKLLTGLLAAGGASAISQDTPLQHVCCPGCGMSFEEFTRIGKFGCADCYNVFGPLIDDKMKYIHGENVHHGKKYNQNNEGKERALTLSEEENLKNRIDELQIRLREAVEIENFEEAARFRDEIKALKGGTNA